MTVNDLLKILNNMPYEDKQRKIVVNLFDCNGNKEIWGVAVDSDGKVVLRG